MSRALLAECVLCAVLEQGDAGMHSVQSAKERSLRKLCKHT